MSDERLQILRMVAEGKVSAEEATNLLDALENAPKPRGPKATHLRVHIVDGRKVTNFSLGVGLVRWVLSIPMLNVELGSARLDIEQLAQLVESGMTGKVMEFSEENRKIEIWLDP
ncbi:MAG: SHOCT-like domain-containing protein [Bacillota bacterium]